MTNSNVSTTYTSNSTVTTSQSAVGAAVNAAANSVTPSSQANSTSASGLTPNEAILKAKEDYVAAQKKGDTAGMAAASKAADEARKAGGTISSNVSLDQTKVIVANETIVQAKADYTEAKKIGDTAGMAAASKTADDARKAGGSISANESLEQAKAVIANDTIVQAKADYTAAQKKGDTAGMTAASKAAEDARNAGGTISANISLEQAQMMTANERILQAKSDYAAAEKAGDKAGMAAASKVAEDARNHGGTIAAATSYEDAREVVANATILQAKIDYDVAYKNKDAQGMADASKKADEARKNGGTIPASTSIEDAKKWVAEADGSGKPKAGSGKPADGSGKPEAGSGKPVDGSGKPVGSDKHGPGALADPVKKQALLNQQLLQAQTDWWEARLNDNEKGMTEAADKGAKLRGEGAQETDATKALVQKYSDLLKQKLSNEAELMKAKTDWWAAYVNFDTAGMDKASSRGAELKQIKYVNDHTAAMDELGEQNRKFMQAFDSYYESKMNLNQAGMKAAEQAMAQADRNGGSLSFSGSFKMKNANEAIVQARIKKYNMQAANDWSGVEVAKADEAKIRNDNKAFSSFLLADKKYEFDTLANDTIYKMRVRWEQYANYSQKELAQFDNEYANKGNNESDSYYTKFRKEIDAQLNQMSSVMGGTFRSTKLDEVNNAIVKARADYWSDVDASRDVSANWNKLQKLFTDNSGLIGILGETQQETNNKLFRSYRKAMNEEIGKGEYDSAIHYLKLQQDMKANEGSDLNIRKAANVTQDQANKLLIHIRKSEWDNVQDLNGADSGLSKVKTAVINNLMADNQVLEKLDAQNRIVLSAKQDYWKHAANMSISGMNTALDAIDRAKNEGASVSGKLDTHFDDLFRRGIELTLQQWTDKGDMDSRVKSNLATLSEQVTKANASLKAFNITAPNLANQDTKLDQTLYTLYDMKKAQWNQKAYQGTEIAYIQQKISESTGSIQHMLNAINKQVSTDIAFPDFALDKANAKVLAESGEIYNAINEGNRSKAEYHLNQGRGQVYQGATLYVDWLVPQLQQVNWSSMAWRNQLDTMAESYNHMVGDKKKITTMQQELTSLGLYNGGVTGEYNEQLVLSVRNLQYLIDSDILVNNNANVEIEAYDGLIDDGLLKFAKNATFKSDAQTVSWYKSLGGVAEGIGRQLYEDASDMVDLVNHLNPLSLDFYRETIPGVLDFSKKLVSGDIKVSDVMDALGEGLKEEFYDPFVRLNDFARKSFNGAGHTYAESVQEGKDIVKAVEALAMLVTFGTVAAAKIAAQAGRLAKGLEEIGEQVVEKFARKGKLHPNRTPNPTHNANGDRIDNVEIPKIRETSDTKQYWKEVETAEESYEYFRKITQDVKSISQNTGWSEADIQLIKNHLFNDKHKFKDGSVRAFAPDYQQSLAWKRLMDGNYNKNDILFLNHELFESNFMKKNGSVYEVAHEEANKYYNWNDAVFIK